MAPAETTQETAKTKGKATPRNTAPALQRITEINQVYSRIESFEKKYNLTNQICLDMTGPRLMGLGVNGTAAQLQWSVRLWLFDGHTEIAQTTAPTLVGAINRVFEDATIVLQNMQQGGKASRAAGAGRNVA